MIKKPSAVADGFFYCRFFHFASVRDSFLIFLNEIALMINQFGNLFTGNLASGAGLAVNIIGLAAAFALLGLMIYMLFFKKYKEATKLTQNVKI